MAADRPGRSDSKPGKPRLAPEDLALWRKVTGDAEPLRRREPAAEPDAPAESGPRAARDKAPRPQPVPLRPKAAGRPPPELAHGAIADVDKRLVERLRRGRLPIEAVLDLHGHRQAEAERTLSAFLAESQAAGRRCVLVITGKGTVGEAGGVLRVQVPRWLNLPPNRARVLAFDYARPRHGGQGALYILLRRRRGEGEK